jgi:hypothetical protein
MSDPHPADIKALFDQLVTAVGTHDAAATFLGISRQRVGQLISTSNNDLPTLMQIAKLERVCGQSVVFGALARMVEGDEALNCALAAHVAANAASGAALSTVYEANADGVLEPHEIDKAQDRARENLEAAQKAFDATMRMKPTLRVVA